MPDIEPTQGDREAAFATIDDAAQLLHDCAHPAARRLRDAGAVLRAMAAPNPCAKIFDHKWLDLACVADGCKSLWLEDAIKKLTKLAFMARTSGGTTGRDEALCAACDDAEALIATIRALKDQPR